MNFYTGIGSRKTPHNVLELMTNLARVWGDRGWILRSGGAAGADQAFSDGSPEYNNLIYPANIFYVSHWTNRKKTGSESHEYSPETIRQAETIAISIMGQAHWNRCSPIAKKFHTRNVFQVLGVNLNTRSNFIACWTPGAKAIGCTATAIKLAQENSIPVFNLGDKNIYERTVDYVNDSLLRQ